MLNYLQKQFILVKQKKYDEILNNSDKDYVVYNTNIIDYINELHLS